MKDTRCSHKYWFCHKSSVDSHTITALLSLCLVSVPWYSDLRGFCSFYCSILMGFHLANQFYTPYHANCASCSVFGLERHPSKCEPQSLYPYSRITAASWPKACYRVTLHFIRWSGKPGHFCQVPETKTEKALKGGAWVLGKPALAGGNPHRNSPCHKVLCPRDSCFLVENWSLVR